jgi:hypothetical protein
MSKFTHNVCAGNNKTLFCLVRDAAFSPLPLSPPSLASQFDAAPLSSSTLVTQLEQTLPGGWGNESGVMPGGAAANNSITHHTADEDLTNSLQDVNISDDPLSAPAPAAQPAAAAAASPAPAQDLGPLSPSAPSPARGAVAAAPPMGGSMGMSYGDLLAPPPSYADSVMYSKPPGEIQSQEEYVTGGGGGGGGGNGFGGGGDAGGHQTITLSQALSGGGGGGGAGLQQGQSSSSSPGGGISGGGVSAGSMEGTLEVTVTDPQKSPETSSSLGAMGRKIVTYKVHARSNLPQYAVGQYKSNPADP